MLFVPSVDVPAVVTYTPARGTCYSLVDDKLEQREQEEMKRLILNQSGGV